MEFITSKSDRLVRAKEGKKGEVRIDESNNHNLSGFPFICVKLRNKWIWKPLHRVSGPTWINNREEVKDFLIKADKNIKKDLKKMERMIILAERNEKNRNEEIKFLFNKLPDYVKNEYFNKFDNKELKYKYCKVCNEICTLDRKECMYKMDCEGMCNICHESWQSGNNMRNGMFVFGEKKMNKHTCPSCNKCQLMECPICYEEKPNSEMIKSDSCTHSICCNCFSKSFKSNPIVECPMCRSQFNRTLTKHPPDEVLPPEDINQIINE